MVKSDPPPGVLRYNDQLPPRMKSMAAFGSAFAAKKISSSYQNGQWSAPEIAALDDLSMHPAAHVLHYGSTCFEGMKAYRRDDSGVHIFRLGRHVQRLRNSAEMLCLPQPPAELIDSMLRQLVIDLKDAVPEFPGSLYLRPTLIGVDANIGSAAKPSSDALLYILASPVGDYFSGGAKPLRLLVDDQHMRATPEFGQVKTGGNYAAALRHTMQARQKYNADQVLFCPGGNVQETGAANFILIHDKTILTKPLDGSILPGITRDSLLKIAADTGYTIDERNFDVAELLDRAATSEAALSGTAAVLASVGTLLYNDREYTVGDGQIGPKTRELRAQLSAIQSGQAEDQYKWRTDLS